MGVHPHAPMKGVQSPCPLLVPVFREAYDRGPSRPRRGEPPCSGAGCRAWTQRLNEAQRALVRSRACALRLPSRRRARTAGEPAAALLPVERESGRATRKKLRQRRSAYAFARRFATSVGHQLTTAPSYQSNVYRKGASTDPWVQLQGTCSRSRGGGTINRGGTL